MKTSSAVIFAIALTLAFALAAQYRNARGMPSDFRDAVGSEGVVEQLQKAAPGDQVPDQPAMPSPQAAEPAAAESPGSGGAAAQSAADSRSVERIFSENDPWHNRLAQLVGINYPCTVETKHIGTASQPIEKLTFDDGVRKELVVVKHVANTSRANELFMRAVSLGSLRYENSAVKMLNNGVAMNEKFRNAGLKTLDIVLADPENLILVTKFLKGTDLGDVMKAALQGDDGALGNMKRFGSALAAAHRNNLSVGDLNLGNVKFVNGEPYFIDLDRAAEGGSRAWDIALLFHHPLLTFTPSAEPQAWTLVARTFLESYLAGGGEAGIIKEALRGRYNAYLAPIYLVRSRSASHAVRHEMKKAAGEDLSPETEEASTPAP